MEGQKKKNKRKLREFLLKIKMGHDLVKLIIEVIERKKKEKMTIKTN